MNSPASSSSKSFSLLDERIQRWVWKAGWQELRDIQERAIPILLEGRRDVILAAPTAAGKTEAAFLPILTVILAQGEAATALYVGPLKALINDQWGRLETLCDTLDIPITPWHGDISASRKRDFLKAPGGCLLITPESLEALFVLRGTAIRDIFRGLRFVVVDELHSFIGTERGRQLQSLLSRIEKAVDRVVPRVGLSATLGEMNLAADFLRPGDSNRVEILESKESAQELKVLVKGYVDATSLITKALKGAGPKVQPTAGEMGGDSLGIEAICAHLFKTLRGSNNLVFPNSRNRVEAISDLLRRQCEVERVPNEFWPHHGSLAKELREETEAALKDKTRATTAICTTTLELGIDIGAVTSIAQIGPAPSVASLRQRLGRSGRKRGTAAIVRCYCLERDLGPDSRISDQLREGLIQTVAQIRLLIRGWCEPPRPSGLHLSTLIQQLQSMIAQHGGITPAQGWNLLCESGPFSKIAKHDFMHLLRTLGQEQILVQDPSGLLLLGQVGEKLVNHYTFYAAFASDDEYRIVCESRTLGSVPISRPLEVGSLVIFAGQRWRVKDVQPREKLIEVVPAKGGRPPLFDGMGGKVHDEVRVEMRRILAEDGPVPFLDAKALHCLAEARDSFARLGLGKTRILQCGNEVRIFTWKGDWVNDSLALLLGREGASATNEGLSIAVMGAEISNVLGALRKVGNSGEVPPEALASEVKNKLREKWDWLLPDDLLCKSFGSMELDVPGAVAVARDLVA